MANTTNNTVLAWIAFVVLIILIVVLMFFASRCLWWVEGDTKNHKITSNWLMFAPSYNTVNELCGKPEIPTKIFYYTPLTNKVSTYVIDNTKDETTDDE